MRTKHQLIMASEQDELARQLLLIDEKPWYIPQETREYLIEEAGNRCKICRKFVGDPGLLHIDHIFPVSRGGRAYLDNLQVLCRTCNLSKSDHALDPRSYTLGYPIPIYLPSEREIDQSVLRKVFDEYS